MNRHHDVLQYPARASIDGVIDHFVNQVMQTLVANIADVHRGRLRTASRPSKTCILSAL